MKPEEILNILPMELWQWLQHEVLVENVLVQLGVLLGGLVAAILLMRPLYRQLKDGSFLEKYVRTPAIQVLIKDCFLPTIWLLLMVLTTPLVELYSYPTNIMKGIATLLVAWVTIRIFSSLVRNNVYSRMIAIIAWTIAAMSILGWLEPAVGFLDNLAFNLGELRISALTIMKGLLTLGVLLWGALAISRLADRQIKAVESLTPSLQVLFSKLLRIILITFAILIGVSSAGIDITALAVFSGAVGVGIGFGLQKIVSNFVSGVILLLDRSIKPGDVIEVEDTYGWINRLSGRHVSVITRDGKEHLIPNEDLITSKVVNWSYSSKSVRIKVPIGVSYHSDIHLVRKLIVQSVEGIPRVLKNPLPVCLLIGFGDNSVDLELRAWIQDPANGVNNVRSEIMLKIWDLFQEHGIEIPFPQRDVHFDMPDKMLEWMESFKRADDKNESPAT